MAEQKFPLGSTVMTRNANDQFHPDDVLGCLRCHAAGDWGELDERRLADLMQAALGFPAVCPSAWFTTTGDLHDHASDAAPLLAPLWRRIGERREELATMTRQQMRGDVADMPRHGLFGRGDSV